MANNRPQRVAIVGRPNCPSKFAWPVKNDTWARLYRQTRDDASDCVAQSPCLGRGDGIVCERPAQPSPCSSSRSRRRGCQGDGNSLPPSGRPSPSPTDLFWYQSSNICRGHRAVLRDGPRAAAIETGGLSFGRPVDDPFHQPHPRRAAPPPATTRRVWAFSPGWPVHFHLFQAASVRSLLKKAILAVFNFGHATASCRRASQTRDSANPMFERNIMFRTQPRFSTGC